MGSEAISVAKARANGGPGLVNIIKVMENNQILDRLSGRKDLGFLDELRRIFGMRKRKETSRTLSVFVWQN